METHPVMETNSNPAYPNGHVKIVYLGLTAPHWEIHSDFGNKTVIGEFNQRVLARLLFLPPHDPQFKRNYERIVKDANRENLLLEWDFSKHNFKT
jgi:hypothetical protein